MTPRKVQYSHCAVHIAAAALISICCFQPVSFGQTADANAEAHDAWRAAISNTDLGEGCFRASYPDTVWQQVECKELHPRVHPVVHKTGQGLVAGNGDDYVAQSS